MTHSRDALLSEEPAAFVHATGLRAMRAVLKEAFWRLYADEAMPLAGNIAYRTILSVFPFLIFLTSLGGFIGNEAIAQRLIAFLLEVAPPELVNPLAPEINSILTVRRGDVLSASLLFMIWTASGGVDSVRVALNRAYDFKEHRNGLVLFLHNAAFILAGAVILLAIGFLIVLAPLGIAFVQRFFPDFSDAFAVYSALRYPVAVITLFITLFAAHVFLPAQWRKLRDLWPGIILTLIVWLLLAQVYAYYLERFANYASTYAGLGGIIAALVFVYLASLIMIFGGEINRAVRLRRKWRQHQLRLERRQAEEHTKHDAEIG